MSDFRRCGKTEPHEPHGWLGPVHRDGRGRWDPYWCDGLVDDDDLEDDK